MTPEETKRLIENNGNGHRTYLGTRTSQLGVEEDVGITDTNRPMHVFAGGPTGAGKTVQFVNAAAQDIIKGRGVCVISPAGNAGEALLDTIPEERVDDVVYLNPNETPVTKINVLEPAVTPAMTAAQRENQKEMITADVHHLFTRLHDDTGGHRFDHHLKTLIRAHVALNLAADEQNTLLDVYHAIVDDSIRRDLVGRVANNADQAVYRQLEHIHNDLSGHDLGPLQWRLETLVQNATVNRVIDAGQSAIDFHRLVTDGDILLVDLKREDIGPDAAHIIGSIAATSVWKAAQSRIAMPEDDRELFGLFIDEIHNFGGATFTTMLAEARKYGLSLWAASQFTKQLDPAMRRAVLHNCRNKIVFEQSSADDLSQIARTLTGIDTADLTNLGEYRAVLQQPGTDPVTFTTLPPWWGDHRSDTEIQQLKRNVTRGDHQSHQRGRGRQESSRASDLMIRVGEGGNAGGERHKALLAQAKQWFDDRSGVQAEVVAQEAGTSKPDGYIYLPDGNIAHLEAEAATLSKPGRVLQNLRRATEAGRECIFIVDQGNAAKLENILSDPVHRQGTTHEDQHGSYSHYQIDGDPVSDLEQLRGAEYRIYEATDTGLIHHGEERKTDCPELEENTRKELESFCIYRDSDGFCEALDQNCVIQP